MRRGSRLRRIVLWAASILVVLGCLAYQDKTGPTYPLEGTVETSRGAVSFKIPRSQTVGQGLPVVLRDPVPEGVQGVVRYRRYKSHDPWTERVMAPGEFQISRRGRSETIRGVGTTLPGLQERAGKYEFFVMIDDGGGVRSVTGPRAIVARYRGAVPRGILLAHIIAVFASMTLAMRTTAEALVGGRYGGMLWATVGSLILGAFLLGPLVQWYAFGVWWSGVPFGLDWTDNKVLVELAWWVGALWTNRGGRRNRTWVVVAGAATLLVYFIPHSVFGSEFDYRTGTGRGTAG